MELQGKVINFLGDSITAGSGVSDVNNRYDNVLKRIANLGAVNNYGIGGTRLAYQSKTGEFPVNNLYFCGRMYLMAPEADIIIVFGGTNDYGHGDAPFGDLTDTTPDTYCGAVDYLMTNLPQVYPKAQIVFITPMHRDCDLTPTNAAPDKKPLKSYVDVIKAKGDEKNIPVLDLYDGLNINPINPEDKEKYMPDGLHINDAGHKILAEHIKFFLERI